MLRDNNMTVMNDPIGDWIHQVTRRHPDHIDQGLDRIKAAAAQLGIYQPQIPIITVGGTNGKGSTVQLLQEIYCAAGYRVGAFTSPHLYAWRERICINGEPVTNDLILETGNAIVAQTQPGTPFELLTLIALLLFQNASLDVIILEVGLGGRLDTTNIIDATVAIITSIGLDHCEWLGDTREAIAKEKAGIMRAQRPAICGDPHAPPTLVEAASEIGAELYLNKRDFEFSINAREDQTCHWCWQFGAKHIRGAGKPRMHADNIASSLMAIELLQSRLPVVETVITNRVSQTQAHARLELITHPKNILFDVAHNPHATAYLASYLRQLQVRGKCIAIVGFLGDKDIEGALAHMAGLVDLWLPLNLSYRPRGLSADELATRMVNAKVGEVKLLPSEQAVLEYALQLASDDDMIIVFGSFSTVQQIKQHLL